jgi:acylphosphatase
MNITRHLRIHGLVQGVYFRESMRERADALNITGWVRNRVDGSVEAMIHGDQQSVTLLIEWAQRGPEHARVTKVDVSEATGAFTSFDKKATS